MLIKNKKESVMGAVIDFDEAKKFRNVSAEKNSSDSLLTAHKHLCEANYKKQEENVIHNSIYLLEAKARNVHSERNISLWKSANIFRDLAGKGCVASQEALKRHFPDTFKDFQQQNKEKS